jgi:hypothetical protein
MSEIRSCTRDDIPAVAALFQRTFRDARTPAPASLQFYLRELYLDHPWHDPELASKVYVAEDGSIGGLIGILPLRLTFRGRPLRAAVAGSLMVDKPQENPLAGARLLRAYFTGPQDLSLSDSANTVSLGMWERLGGKAVVAESMEWVRAFRPAATMLALAAEAAPPARLARPLAAAADLVALRMAHLSSRFAPPASPTGDRATDDEELVRLIPEFAESYVVRPAWDAATLRWVLAHMARKERHGPMIARAVLGKDDRPLGCYVYYGRRGGVAFVLQMFSRPETVEPVLDNLLAHAAAQGCVAVRGRTQARLLDALQRRDCVFFRHNATVAHSANAELMAAIRAGDALITGLAGDGWTRLVGDTFT